MQTDEERTKLFLAAGLPEGKAKDTLKNKTLSENFCSVLNGVGISHLKPCDKSIGMLLYNLTTKFSPTYPVEKRGLIANYIKDGKIKSDVQVNGKD